MALDLSLVSMMIEQVDRVGGPVGHAFADGFHLASLLPPRRTQEADVTPSRFAASWGYAPFSAQMFDLAINLYIESEPTLTAPRVVGLFTGHVAVMRGWVLHDNHFACVTVRPDYRVLTSRAPCSPARAGELLKFSRRLVDRFDLPSLVDDDVRQLLGGASD